MSDGNGRDPLTRDAILAKDDLTIERVEVPEWGGHIHVRTLTAAERDAFESATLREVDGKVETDTANVRAKLVVLVACTADGERLFTDVDAEMLGTKSSLAVSRIYRAAAPLSGLSLDEEIKAAEKN